MYNMFIMHDDESGVVNGPEGRQFYGSVTVGERGQVVIPAQARRDHGIGAGDKLIVLGSDEGIALMGVERLMETLSASTTLLNTLREQTSSEADR